MEVSREQRTDDLSDLGYIAFKQYFSPSDSSLGDSVEFKCLYDATSTTNSLELALNLEDTKQVVHQTHQVGIRFNLQLKIIDR